MLFFRGGYKFGYDLANYSFGVGIYLDVFKTVNLRLDYSYTDMGILNDVHRGTAGISF
jgi:hypothetical protein